MVHTIFLLVGAGLTALWGIAHLFPTRSVVEGFGNISADNKRIIAMEWIVEGVALIFIGVLVSVVTLIDPSSAVSRAVYLTSSGGLVVLAVVSLFTGFQVKLFPFKLCPLIFTASAILIIWGGYL
ncbi:MAG: hypothetical protein WCB96_07045 [Candidatus Aminicenantales bacterium]